MRQRTADLLAAVLRPVIELGLCLLVSAASPAAAPAERGAVLVAAPRPGTDQRVALVIGNSRYRQQPLPNPVLDAKAMATTLGRLGFKVTSLTDSSRTAMVRALEEFKRQLRGAGVGLFYFAGHGVQIDGRNYLIPVDNDMASEDQVKYNTIRLDDVLDTLNEGGPAVKIVVLDACRNNPFQRARGSGGGLAPVLSAAEGTLIAYATSPGKVALDGKPGENGLYTSHLLEALQEPGLKIEEVFKLTRTMVARATGGRQLPWETTSLLGELILKPGTPAPATMAASAGGSAQQSFRGLDRAARPERLSPGASFRDCERCPEMVVVPTGAFTMGSPGAEPDRHPSEGPQHEVAFARAFAVGRFEVTFEEWEACLLDGGCDRWPSDQGWGRGKRPVIDVNWEDATRYAAWLSRRTGKPYRLLSEAEWEYAARAGATTARPWGTEIGTARGNCSGCGGADGGRRTTPAGSFAANRWGLSDMLGNAWEWVADCRNPTYEGAPADGTAWVTGDCALRMLRGGSWVTAPRGVRSATRAYFPAARRDVNIGFRVATSLD
ncbi:MAG: SUMF1/EgtB/PvdO family nonheme iron enzyme [Betaproteobacteria bacterium]|nr:SUMF1/EgtB/PvdO family nonheme iron enzyme [Betaproteobacteria bacterium]MBI3938442.1 SUMF1/EgtB/PvdO family nonheme iron enzyme [Betaproteobacteria bacterium]